MIVKTEGGASTIWCVEDDSSIRDIEVYALTSTGFDAKGFEYGDFFGMLYNPRNRILLFWM